MPFRRAGSVRQKSASQSLYARVMALANRLLGVMNIVHCRFGAAGAERG